MIWLVSYPKSGNTWIRFVLFYLHHKRMPLNSTELDRSFNSKLPVRQSDWAKKSHAKFNALSNYISDEDKIIYLHRHPLDVLQSAFNYARLNGDIRESELEKKAWIEDYIVNRGVKEWKSAPFFAGSWDDNVNSWLTHEASNILKQSYETTKSDPERSIAIIADFLNIKIDQPTLARCVAATSFESLRAFEKSEMEAATKAGVSQGRFSGPARIKNMKRGVRFFNKGKSGAYGDILTGAQIERAWQAFRTTAERLGYGLSA